MKFLKYIAASFLILACAALAAPILFSGIDKSDFTPDYRIPYSQGEDYFLFQKYAESLDSSRHIALTGDSVIWGHYTSEKETLSSLLNTRTGSSRFRNLGIDGIHPAALAGLLENYGSSVSDMKIIIGINPLWMSSPRHDLTGEKNSEINHRRLLNQFFSSPPSYDAGFEERLSHIIKRPISFFGWMEHIKLSRFADTSFYRWTVDNPHTNPFEYIRKNSGDYTPPAKMKTGNMRQNVGWVSAEKSLQWRYMKKAIEILKSRGNRVIAVITPYNTASLTDESIKLYSELKKKIEDDLSVMNISFISPEVLSPEYYADASHPDSRGYRILCKKLLDSEMFRKFISF